MFCEKTAPSLKMESKGLKCQGGVRKLTWEIRDLGSMSITGHLLYEFHFWLCNPLFFFL